MTSALAIASKTAGVISSLEPGPIPATMIFPADMDLRLLYNDYVYPYAIPRHMYKCNTFGEKKPVFGPPKVCSFSLLLYHPSTIIDIIRQRVTQISLGRRRIDVPELSFSTFGTLMKQRPREICPTRRGLLFEKLRIFTRRGVWRNSQTAPIQQELSTCTGTMD